MARRRAAPIWAAQHDMHLQARLASHGDTPICATVAPTEIDDRALVLDCLRTRDLGGDWLGHASFDLVEDRDGVTSALVRDGLAAWDDFGIHITARGRRAWADQRRASQRDDIRLVNCCEISDVVAGSVVLIPFAEVGIHPG